MGEGARQLASERGIARTAWLQTPSGGSIVSIPVAIREVLACPRCRGALTDRADGTALECARCALAYPIRDGIPVMLVDRAEPMRR
ncbi:MAG: Trm112 family protein [Gemmatimonadaceae bacterium]